MADQTTLHAIAEECSAHALAWDQRHDPDGHASAWDALHTLLTAAGAWVECLATMSPDLAPAEADDIVTAVRRLATHLTVADCDTPADRPSIAGDGRTAPDPSSVMGAPISGPETAAEAAGMTPVEFILARLADVEAFCEGAICRCGIDGGLHDPDCPLIVLAEVDAKRRIVAQCVNGLAYGNFGEATLAEAILQRLATVFADHPDYDESWRP